MTHPLRPPYARADLARLLAPRSIAIMGATPEADSTGARALDNLEWFEGPIHIISSSYRQINGITCHATIAALPEAPDCVIIATPRDAVEGAVAKCACAGAGGVIIFPSHGDGKHGAGKSADEESAFEGRLSALSRASGLPIIGPGSVGLVNYMNGAAITHAAAAGYGFLEAAHPESRRIGLVSQSGSVGFSLSLAAQRGVAFSHVLCSGHYDQCVDVDVADFVSYLAEDPDCHAIACVFEDLPDPKRFLEAADIAWAADKPLVVHKIGTATPAPRGSAADSNEAWRALFERGRVICVDHLEALIETAAFFARARRMKARGVAVSTSSGGLAVMSADKAELHGVPLPQPSETIRAKLAALIPDFGAARNPCDVTAAIVNDRTLLSAAGDAFLSDPAYGALIVTHPLPWDLGPRVAALSQLVQRHDKMICNILTGEWLEAPGSKDVELNPLTTVFRSMDRCFTTLAAWHRREDERAASTTTAGNAREPAAGLPRRRVAPATAVAAAAGLLETAAGSPLSGRDSVALLAAYGVPVVAEIPARPVAPEKIALVLRARNDPRFGPLVEVELGGMPMKVLEDTSMELAPVDHRQAMAMLDRLQGKASLSGYRGSVPVDLGRLAGIICRLSELAADQRDRIGVFSVALAVLPGSGIMATDALIVPAQRIPPHNS